MARYNAADGNGTTTDHAGHGTAVASVIAARSDAVGMAGGASGADLLAVKVEDHYGDVWSDAVADGIRWAVSNGARISVSLGTSQPDALTADAVAAVSGAVPVSAASSAARVRFGITGTAISADAPVVDGTASAVLPTWGLTGARTVTAVSCSAVLCASQTAAVSVLVGNPPPTLTAPATGAVVGTSLVATATAGGGGVRFLIDGVSRGFTAASPYTVTITTGALADRAHTLTAVQCNTGGTVCDTAHPSAARSFTVQRLRPTLTVGPSPFSPNADGRRTPPP